MKKEARRGAIFKVWAILSYSLLAAFFIFTLIIGGNAGIGYHEAGRYFVGDHGDYVEVSYGVWVTSTALEVLFWTSVLLTPLRIFLESKFKVSEKKNETGEVPKE